MAFNISRVIVESEKFLARCRIENSYAFKPNLFANVETLYSSVFAVMSFHYSGKLARTDRREKDEWLEYILSFQDIGTGLYDSPELHGEIGVHHNLEHRRLHLTCHVLPAIALLGGKPRYPIKYTERYLEIADMRDWLNDRDLSMAWVEGNNLLFVGQLLVHEIETTGRGQETLNLLFEWLEANVDPKTALWGTDRGCSIHKAMYGAYHQLVLYYYLDRPISNIEKLVDSVLECQHFDGGFSEWRGGGTCQDIDGIDILVNCYKVSPYRRRDIRRALRRSLGHIINDRYAPASGGFIDRKGHEFIHNSMPLTKTPPDTANTFSTWFTMHALMDIASVLQGDSKFAKLCPRFNTSCSMGWGKSARLGVGYSRLEETTDGLVSAIKRIIVRTYDLVKRIKD